MASKMPGMGPRIATPRIIGVIGRTISICRRVTRETASVRRAGPAVPNATPLPAFPDSIAADDQVVQPQCASIIDASSVPPGASVVTGDHTITDPQGAVVANPPSWTSGAAACPIRSFPVSDCQVCEEGRDVRLDVEDSACPCTIDGERGGAGSNDGQILVNYQLPAGKRDRPSDRKEDAAAGCGGGNRLS